MLIAVSKWGTKESNIFPVWITLSRCFLEQNLKSLSGWQLLLFNEESSILAERNSFSRDGGIEEEGTDETWRTSTIQSGWWWWWWWKEFDEEVDVASSISFHSTEFGWREINIEVFINIDDEDDGELLLLFVLLRLLVLLPILFSLINSIIIKDDWRSNPRISKRICFWAEGEDSLKSCSVKSLAWRRARREVQREESTVDESDNLVEDPVSADVSETDDSSKQQDEE